MAAGVQTATLPASMSPAAAQPAAKQPSLSQPAPASASTTPPASAAVTEAVPPASAAATADGVLSSAAQAAQRAVADAFEQAALQQQLHDGAKAAAQRLQQLVRVGDPLAAEVQQVLGSLAGGKAGPELQLLPLLVVSLSAYGAAVLLVAVGKAVHVATRGAPSGGCSSLLCICAQAGYILGL